MPAVHWRQDSNLLRSFTDMENFSLHPFIFEGHMSCFIFYSVLSWYWHILCYLEINLLPYQISHMEERVNVKEQLVLDLQKRSKVGAWRWFVWAHVLFNYFFGTVPFIFLLRIWWWVQKLEEALINAKKLSSHRQKQLTKVTVIDS